MEKISNHLEALALVPEIFMKKVNARLESLEGTFNTFVSKCNISENKGLIVKITVDVESNSVIVPVNDILEIDYLMLPCRPVKHRNFFAGHFECETCKNNTCLR